MKDWKYFWRVSAIFCAISVVFHVIKMSFVIPEACAIIFSTASLVDKFMKQRNKKMKKYTLWLMYPLFSFYLKKRSTIPDICSLIFTTARSIPNISIFHFFFNIDFLFRYFINLNTGEAVLNIIAQASGFTKLIFTRWRTRNPMSSPIPERENSRFWLFRDKFVIYEAVLNIIVPATAFARVFLHKG